MATQQQIDALIQTVEDEFGIVVTQGAVDALVYLIEEGIKLPDRVKILNPDDNLVELNQVSDLSVVELINEENQSTGETREIVDFDGFKNLSIHHILTSGVSGDKTSIKLYGTNISAADTTSLDEWVDLTDTLLNTLTLESDNDTIKDINLIDTSFCVLKLMVEINYTVAGAADNSAKVYIKKRYSNFR